MAAENEHTSKGDRGDRLTIDRALLPIIEDGLERDVCTLLVGPYEVGKSELAREIARRGNGQYLNARRPDHRDVLMGDNGAVCNSAGKLLIVDEIQDLGDALDLIHTEIDAAKYNGKSIGHFLLLGSQQAEQLVSSKLGTRARVHRMSPVDLSELLNWRGEDVGDARTLGPAEPETTAPVQHADDDHLLARLWLRGGFPDSLLAENDNASFEWREAFIERLCARGYAHLHPALAAPSIRHFLQQIAWLQGETLDVNSLPSEQRPCLAHFEALGLIRQLRPWFGNERKRLKKPPKVYIRDSGLLHALLRLQSHEEIRANAAVYGHSWEGLCVENLIIAAGNQATPYFYRSNDDTEEIDLVLEFLGGATWAIEMKGPASCITRNFENAANAVGAVRKFVVRPVPESYDEGSYRVMTLRDAMTAVRLGPGASPSDG